MRRPSPDGRPGARGRPEALPPICLMGEKLNDSTSCAITFVFFFKEILFTTVYIICKGFCFTFAPSMTQLSKKTKQKQKKLKKKQNKKKTPSSSAAFVPCIHFSRAPSAGEEPDGRREAPAGEGQCVSQLGARMCFFRDLYIMSSTAAFTVPPGS